MNPACSIIDSCGGCSQQQLPYAEQLTAKRNRLVAGLRDLCAAEAVEPVVGLRHPYGYRTRLLMPALPITKPRVGEAPIRFGFYAAGSQNLVEASGCPVQHPLTLSALAMVKHALVTAPLRATAPRQKGGWLHGLAIRVDPPSGSTELTLIGRNGKPPGGKKLAERLARLPGIRGVHGSINPGRSSYLMGDAFFHMAGARRTVFNLAGEAFHLSPGSFFQTSHEGAERLVDLVGELLPASIECLADLYGGVGVFARVMRHRWGRAIVAENNPSSIGDLRGWQRHGGSRKLKAIEGRVESVIDNVLSESPDAVVLDPPRAGCHDRVIGALAQAKPPLIVYVACGFKAFVRDAAALSAAGYRLDLVKSVDMFPHTEHIEVVARFTC